MEKLNVYDFDNTIYNGESAIDFFIFCLKKDIKWCIYLPKIAVALIKYKLGFIKINDVYEKYSKLIEKFIMDVGNMDSLIVQFWDTHEKKIKEFYYKNHNDNDIIISASPNFLLEEICNRINIREYIGSDVDKYTGKINYLCYRENKKEIYYKKYGNKIIDNFYTDSWNDLSMMSISKNSYFVKKNKIKKISNEKIEKKLL